MKKINDVAIGVFGTLGGYYFYQENHNSLWLIYCGIGIILTLYSLFKKK